MKSFMNVKILKEISGNGKASIEWQITNKCKHRDFYELPIFMSSKKMFEVSFIY